jgi:hypothetical protein
VPLPLRSTPNALAVAQQAKAETTRAEAEATRPGDLMPRRVKPFLQLLSFLSLS